MGDRSRGGGGVDEKKHGEGREERRGVASK